ncbi:tandem-95 repeat protein [Mumia zhuanghuii]|uniref:Tandem-95 repeat protein n=1 Tax=Mumia zhuanghuii TaxID=2585211 RepID=A0A5Q6RW81_9ACTN|nr:MULTISPECIES: Ig-like domain-containing protein [Mumia]KAA1422321.1 tandem-95 repeat protein [Mumia zhuanghuii]
MSRFRSSTARKPLSLTASGALVAGMAVSVTALGTSAAQADDVQLDKNFTYTCNVVAAGLPLGDHAVGVNAKVVIPDAVDPGTEIPGRKTQITLTLPETLRNATYGLLSARTASGYSNNANISITVPGITDPFVYPIANLAAPWSPVPASSTPPWQIPTEGDVPAIDVPSPAEYPGLQLPTTGTIHMPASFNVIASLRNANGDLVGGEGAVTMACALPTGSDRTFGTFGINAAEEPNTPPTAGDVSVSTAYGTAVDVALEGADADGDDLTYTYAQPANGTVSGSGANVTYTPDDGFSGSDSFEYTVSDGEAEATGTVSVTVGEAPNTPPTAGDVSASTDYGTSVDIALEGADADGDTLSYSYGTPANGTVSGSGANVTYTPAAGFSGSDSFDYTVSDGEAEATGTVTVTVGEQPNTPPVAVDGSVTLDENTSADVTLSATDADGDDLTYTYSQPANGTVTGSGATVTYTPTADFVGTDSFTFTVDDGNGGTDTATIAITVNDTEDPNTPPTAGNVAAETDEDTAVDIALEGADADGDELTYSYSQPANGTVTGSGDSVTYTPADGFFGEDIFTYTVSDGTDSATGAVTVTVNEVVDPPDNTPPTAGNVAAETDEDTAVDITLAGADADGDELTYTYGEPSNGTVSGEGADVTYTPADGFFGEDTFTYTVSDGEDEATGTVTVTVNEVVDPPDNTPPTAGNVAAETDEDTAVDIALAGADADGDALTYTYGEPGHGTVTGTGGSVTYTPADGFFGEDTFTYTVSDGEDEATGTVTVTVNEVEEPPVNTPPTAAAVTATTDQGKAVAIALKGADADGDTLAYSYGTPANGTVTGTGANVTYTPKAGFSGTDSFTYSVDDGKGGTASAAVTVTVKPVTTPPVDKCGPMPNPIKEPLKWLKWLACKIFGQLHR